MRLCQLPKAETPRFRHTESCAETREGLLFGQRGQTEINKKKTATHPVMLWGKYIYGNFKANRPVKHPQQVHFSYQVIIFTVWWHGCVTDWSQVWLRSRVYTDGWRCLAAFGPRQRLLRLRRLLLGENTLLVICLLRHFCSGKKKWKGKTCILCSVSLSLEEEIKK